MSPPTAARILLTLLAALLASPVAQAAKPRLDAWGDPLPPGALFRTGTLRDRHHMPIVNDGLWALQFGTATTGGTGTLLFSAGLNDEADGLVGAINPAK